MKRTQVVLYMMLVALAFFIPQESFALGIEASVGYWSQDFSGDNHIEYEGTQLDLEDDLDYGKEYSAFGRLKADLPLFLPNIYLMATPVEFDGTGGKTFDFKFGDFVYQAGTAFESELQLDHYDIAFYYELPFLSTATLGKLNAEIGINARIIDFEAKGTGTETVTGLTVTESESFTLPIPMLYVGVQFEPIDALSFEVEGRGIVYSDSRYLDFIGRVKLKPFGPLFIAGGYRYEDFAIDYSDVELKINFHGPFVEGGIDF